MKISESITIYYQSEIRHCLITSVGTGIVMLFLSLFLFWLSVSSHSAILKGVSLIVFMGSLVFGLGGYFAGKTAQKSMDEKIALFERSQQEFAKQEFAKVEAIHKNWKQIKILWATIILVGLIVLFISSHTIWTGLGIGLLIVGTIGMIEETTSMQHNEKYRTEVLKYKIQNNF